MAPATYAAGGRQQLVSASESGGEGGLAAALALSHISLEEAAERDARNIAVGVLARTIKIGTREDRTIAMVMSPSDEPIVAAIREAREDSDAGIALVAYSRLAHDGKDDAERKASIEKLFEIAKSDDVEAHRAMGELAIMGDRRVVALLEKQLGSENAFARGYAARNLVVLGEFVKAARALADADSYVRATTACAILQKR